MQNKNTTIESYNSALGYSPNDIEQGMVKTDKDMSYKNSVLFLAWESPWPAIGGAHLRALGLLTELSKVYNIELIILSSLPLTQEQLVSLKRFAQKITRIALRDGHSHNHLAVVGWMIRHRLPYHPALLEYSLAAYPEIQEYILHFPGVVFTDRGHWATLIRKRPAQNWILNQCDADVDFWRVYASQTRKFTSKIGALISWQLSKMLFPQLYTKVGSVISVCEEDRILTYALSSQAKVEIIENGVDCDYYVPQHRPNKQSPVILFTGSSAARNVIALHKFVKDVFPFIQKELPAVELLVAGNFSPKAQAEFSGISHIRFTGRVEDIRPYFAQGDVFIAYFEETHGSKLKIAEAMAMAMPIVATPQGARGFPLVDGESVLLAQSPQQFAEQVISLLKDQERRISLGAKAREVALATVDWNILGKRLVHIITPMLSESKV